MARAKLEQSEAQRTRIKRKENKQRILKEMGGKCMRCGYSDCAEALEFHHMNPDNKINHVANLYSNYDKLKAEVEKCVLVCANCHREIHAKLKELILPR